MFKKTAVAETTSIKCDVCPIKSLIARVSVFVDNLVFELSRCAGVARKSIIFACLSIQALNESEKIFLFFH